MKDIQVSSWNDLNEQLFEGSWNEQIARFRSNYAFRGMPDSRYDLKTSLIQLGGDFGSHEADLLRNFRKYAYRNALPGDGKIGKVRPPVDGRFCDGASKLTINIQWARYRPRFIRARTTPAG